MLASRKQRFRTALIGVIGLVALFAAACGGASNAASPPATPTRDPGVPETPLPPENVTLRLGYFANITHAVPVVGVASGDFQQELGPTVKLETKIFGNGNDAVTAIFAGAVDAAYVGPNPAINGYIKSDGKALRIVAGAASGGALFVVKPDIDGPKGLAGKSFATPGLGNTQDVALRSYLQNNGLKTKEDGGNVTVLPMANSDALTAFKKGDIQGAWEPEPWATRLVKEGGAKVLVDERTLWPQGDFVTTQLIVSTNFLNRYPGTVERLVRADVKEAQAINADPTRAKQVTNQAIKDLTGQALSQDVIDAAWPNLKFTYDPIASSLKKSADDAFALGFLGGSKPNLAGIYDLSALNKVLCEQNLAEVPQ